MRCEYDLKQLDEKGVIRRLFRVSYNLAGLDNVVCIGEMSVS